MVVLLDSLAATQALILTQNDPLLSTAIAISLGAIPGALSRYYLMLYLVQRWGNNFPYGTLAINLSGALLMGFFTTLFIEQVITSSKLQLLITTGFLGSYTTFSTYALDTSILWHSGNRVKAFFYWAGSVVLGGICLAIGISLAQMVR
ncbi:fluoride efflux transporter CrcB [Chroococcidiopsis sp. TS-821]|uniref:fluoride efflux transporter CrcB n=1 Tax=Chroococcidiopsis sp. TS-821 TaxID=1378066 RepID=UPI001AEF5D68|nr:fluoride efflux transporter CrcB [Chroococcidiopsis sp. TS-821]